ncbi:MAG: PAS domain S-box protein [Candidatus Helarchaeota archaeon]|nr:PAS domain S-box protein [Candidatus Helarchaeota archaeon]
MGFEEHSLESKLKESEEKFRTITENSLIGISIIQDNRLKYVNQAAADIIGYSIEELMNWKISDIYKIIHSQDLEILLNIVEKDKGLKEPAQIQYRAIKKNGKIVWVDNYTKQIMYEGNPAILIMSKEFTDTKEAEQKIKESEAKYRLISENIIDMIDILDDSFKIEYINEKAHMRISGYSWDESIGKDGIRFIHPDDIDIVLQATKRDWEKGEGIFEARSRIKDGRYLWIETKWKRFTDIDGKGKFLTVSRDITDQKLTEQKLKQSEENYREILDFLPDIIYELDTNFNIIYFNRAGLKKFGYSQEEIDKGLNISRLVPPNELERAIKNGKNIINRIPLPPQEYVMVKKDGTKFWGRVLAKPIIKGEKILGLRGVISDITEQKWFQDMVIESEEKFRRIFHSIPDLFFIVSGETTVLDYSGRQQDFFIPPEEILGKKMVDILPPKLGKKSLDLVKKTLKTQKPHTLEYTLLMKGELEYFEARFFYLTENKISIFIRNITKRKIAEERLSRKNELLNAINKVFQDAIVCQTDKEVANTCLQVALQLTESEFGFIGELTRSNQFNFIAINAPGWDLSQPPTILGEEIMKFMKMGGFLDKILKTKRSYIISEPSTDPYTADLPNQHPQLTSFLGVPIIQGDNTIGMIGLANKRLGYDITDQRAMESLSVAFIEALMRKRAEREVKEHHERLEEMMQESMIQLKISQKELKKKTIEHTKTGEELKESEAKYRETLNFLPDIIFEVSDKIELTYANEIAFEKFGFTIEEFNKGLKIDQLLVQNEIERALKYCNKALNGIMLEPDDFLFKRKDGTNFWGRVHTSPIYKEGKIVGIRGVLSDIDARKRVEEELEQKMREMEIFINNIPHMAWLKDVDSNFILANQKFGDVVGMDPEYLRNHTCAICFGEEAAEKFKEDDKVVMEGKKKITFEETIVDKDGEEINLETTKSPIFNDNGNVIGTVGIAIDITDSKKIEGKLRESEQRFRNFIETFSDGILVADVEDKKFYFGNKMISEMLGYTLEEIEKLGVMDIHLKKDLDYVLEQFDKLTRREILLAKDIPIKRKDGTIFYADINTSSIILDERQYLVGAFRDITERRNMEEQLRELTEDLAQKVEEQTQKLKEAQEKLIHKEKVEAVGKFVGGISGKLKSPFEIINNSLFNLRLKLKDASGDVRRNLNIIQQAVNRACDLILGLPEYSKFKLPMLIKGDVNNIVKEALQDTEIHEDIIVESQLDNNLPSIDLDPNQIKQALINIILNSVQAMPNGGKLTIRTQLKGDFIEVDFKDTGEGIAEEYLEKIFEPLFSTKAVNIGLGLPIVKDIINKHNGKVTIESKIGEGTKITINLPVSQNKK